MANGFGIVGRSLGGGNPNVQPSVGGQIFGRSGGGGGYGRGLGSAAAALARKRLQFAGQYPNGQPPTMFNLYGQHPGVAPNMLDPESFVRRQQRGSNFGRGASEEQLNAYDEASRAWGGLPMIQKARGLAQGAAYGQPFDALRRMLKNRMGAV